MHETRDGGKGGGVGVELGISHVLSSMTSQMMLGRQMQFNPGLADSTALECEPSLTYDHCF